MKVNKCLMIVLVMFVFAVTSYGYALLNWGDGGGFAGHELYDSGDVDVTSSANGWLFQVVVDTDGDTDFTSMLADGYWYVGSEDGGGGSSYNSDDDVTYSSDGGGQTGWFGYYYADATFGGLFSDFSTLSNMSGTETNADFYVRWFNGTTTGASEAGIIYSATDSWQTWSGDAMDSTPTVNIDYGMPNVTGSDNTGNTGWASMAPIPEPGTFVLMGVGAAALLGRRRRRQ